MNQFKDKVAVVTGGGSGIGRAVCEETARRGALVIAADINMEAAQKVASAIVENGGKAEAAHIDVAREEDVRKLVEETAFTHGRIDYMFNNAGIGIVGEVRDMDLDHWRRIIDVNLWGVIYGTTAAYQVMLEQGFGHIVNTASMAGLIPPPGLTAYSTTKYAVVGLSTSLRAEAVGLGVKVSVICPGLIRTGIVDAITYINIEREDVDSLLEQIKMMDPDKGARIILRGVARNKAIIIVGRDAGIAWKLYPLHPALIAREQRKGIAEHRKIRRAN